MCESVCACDDKRHARAAGTVAHKPDGGERTSQPRLESSRDWLLTGAWLMWPRSAWSCLTPPSLPPPPPSERGWLSDRHISSPPCESERCQEPLKGPREQSHRCTRGGRGPGKRPSCWSRGAGLKAPSVGGARPRGLTWSFGRLSASLYGCLMCHVRGGLKPFKYATVDSCHANTHTHTHLYAPTHTLNVAASVFRNRSVVPIHSKCCILLIPVYFCGAPMFS